MKSYFIAKMTRDVFENFSLPGSSQFLFMSSKTRHLQSPAEISMKNLIKNLLDFFETKPFNFTTFESTLKP